MSNLDKPAMPTEHIPGGWRNQGDLSEGLTIRQHAAIALRVPMSGDPELDAMIREARRLDMATAAMQGLIYDKLPETELSTASDYSFAMADAMLAASEPKPDYETLERKHLGDAEKKTGIYALQPDAASEPKKAEPEHKHEIVPMFGCDAEGWVEWKGGNCPVAPDQVVRVRLRNGGEHVGAADYFSWAHLDDVDIIAYRIVK